MAKRDRLPSVCGEPLVRSRCHCSFHLSNNPPAQRALDGSEGMIEIARNNVPDVDLRLRDPIIT